MKTILNIKTDKELKTEAQKVAKALGLSLSAVITQQLKNFVKERTVLFTDHPTPNASTRKMLDEALHDVSKKKNLSKSFSTADQLFASLDK